jgi:hypothetical protein
MSGEILSNLIGHCFKKFFGTQGKKCIYCEKHNLIKNPKHSQDPSVSGLYFKEKF